MAEGTQNHVVVEGPTASGVNSTCITQPHIVQYPRPPKRDDGRWMALSTVIGATIGQLSNQSVVKRAEGAESDWKKLLNDLDRQAKVEWARVKPLRDQADAAMKDLDKRNAKNWDRSDEEYDYGEGMKPCIDNTIAALCATADCGYEPDYAGVLARVKADAEREVAAASAKYCGTMNRYNIGMNCEALRTIEATGTAMAISAASTARTQERALAWDKTTAQRMALAQFMESARQGRQNTSQSYDRTANDIRFRQYTGYTNDALQSLQHGADMLASTGQNLAWLAESYRRTADKSAKDWGKLSAMIIGLMLTWNSASSEAQNTECGG